MNKKIILSVGVIILIAGSFSLYKSLYNKKEKVKKGWAREITLKNTNTDITSGAMLNEKGIDLKKQKNVNHVYVQKMKNELLKNKLNYKPIAFDEKQELETIFNNSVKEVYSDKNINIFISNNLKSPIKQDRLDNIVKRIKQNIKAGSIVVYEDAKQNINLYVIPTKLSIQQDSNITENLKITNRESDISYIIVQNSGSNLAIKIYNPKDSTQKDTLKFDNQNNNIMYKNNNVYHFPFNKYTIVKNENIDDYLESLKFTVSELGKDLKEIIIIGYTDNIGNKDYNILLSYKRARSLKKQIEKYKIKVRYIAKGESSPVASNETKEGRAMNRRIEIYLVIK